MFYFSEENIDFLLLSIMLFSNYSSQKNETKKNQRSVISMTSINLNKRKKSKTFSDFANPFSKM